MNLPNSENDTDRAWETLDKVVTASINEQRRAHRWGVVFKGLTFAYLFLLLGLFYPWSSSAWFGGADKHTALIDIKGLIAEDQDASANRIVVGLRRAFEDENTAGVILAINSPGGSPVQAAYVFDEIKRLRALHESIKVYAVISDMGASGAYYIAAAADEIYANPSSLVGSIGVVSAGFGFVGTLEKLGVERRLIVSGNNKGLLDPFMPLDQEQKAHWQNVLTLTHEEFIARVKEGRGDRLGDDAQLFSGLVWNGKQAMELGLIDGFGSAGYVAREVIGSEDVVDYTPKTFPLAQFTKGLGTSIGSAITSAFLDSGLR